MVLRVRKPIKCLRLQLSWYRKWKAYPFLDTIILYHSWWGVISCSLTCLTLVTLCLKSSQLRDQDMSHLTHHNMTHASAAWLNQLQFSKQLGLMNWLVTPGGSGIPNWKAFAAPLLSRRSQTHSSKGSGKIWNPSLGDFAGALFCCKSLSNMTQEAARLTLARVLARFRIQIGKIFQGLCSAARACLV